VSNSVWPHRWQPTRFPRPWDSPGKNTGLGCHFLLQWKWKCMKVKSEREVAQSCLTLSDSMDCSLPGSSAHGIFQARVLEWGATAFSNICMCMYVCIYIYIIKDSWLTMFQVYSKVIQLYTYTYITFHIIFHYTLLQDTDYSSLCYIANLCCLLHIWFFFN